MNSQIKNLINTHPWYLLTVVRLGLLFTLLLVVVASQLIQSLFINIDFIVPVYSLMMFGFCHYFITIAAAQSFIKNSSLQVLSFALDIILVTALLYFSGLNQSMFLFMYLVNIMATGFIFRLRGAFINALVSSILFTILVLFKGEASTPSNLFLLIFNDAAFLAVAGLSGYLSEQLQFVDQELQRTGQSLSRLRDLHKKVIEQMPVGLILFNSEGLVFEMNIAAKEYFASEENPLNIFSLLPQLKKTFMRFVKTQSLVRDEIYYSDKEKERVFSVSLSLASLSGVTESIYLCLIEDQTQIRNLELSVRRSEKLAAIGSLAAGIAHEIRNPLASISGSVQMMQQTSANEDDKKLMSILLKETDRLNLLITEFLDFSRPEEPVKDPVHLNVLLTELVSLVKVNDRLRANIDYELDLDKQDCIRGQKDKLKQAFLNILINGAQAMRESESAKLRVKTKVHDKRLTVLIKDSGEGMTEAQKARLFEPFFTTKKDGTGLGLAVTHKIFENHGAQIFVESEKGRGTEFHIEFPLLTEQINENMVEKS